MTPWVVVAGGAPPDGDALGGGVGNAETKDRRLSP
jgi:hypothetical protein